MQIRDRVNRRASWNSARDALHLAANSERLANCEKCPESVKEFYRKNAAEFRAIAAMELRKIRAPFIAMQEVQP